MKTNNIIGIAIIPTRKENIAEKQKENKPTDINYPMTKDHWVCN